MDSSVTAKATEAELANSIRALAMDAVEAAKSGHPGMPMGMAEIAVALWKRHLRHNPANPDWPNRDRFVLSNGHGSMLLYSLLHLTGYALPIEELKRFRQLGSKTPGHPERGCAPGVETTTGPLGQGLANAVGMALAERLLAARFNKPEPRAGRPLHLRLPRRRLHDGRHLARGLRPRRHPGPGQADRPLRRQRHLDRLGQGPDQAVVHRRRAQALRGLRLAGDPQRRRPRRRGGRQGDPQGEAGEATTPDADLLQDRHRQGRAEEGQHRRGARRAARRRGDRRHPRRHRLAAPGVRDPQAGLRRLGRPRGRQARWSGAGRSCSRATRRSFPEDAAEFERRDEGRAARGFRRHGPGAAGRLQHQGRDHRHPQGVAERARSAWCRRCRSWSAARPT